MKQKIYEFQINGEKEWICADTLFEALKFYYSINDLKLTDYDNCDDIIEVPKEKWSSMNILNIEEPRDDNGHYPVIETFEQYMQHAQFTEIIATTCY
jgi:hypothetical protein